MNARTITSLALGVALVTASGCAGAYAAAGGIYGVPAVVAADPPPPPSVLTGTAAAEAAAQEGVEVLAGGPVHEAFAEPVSRDPSQTVIVSRRPPDPLPETPPALGPADDRAIWIPGYWAWDDDRNDFIWVSGTWRVPPPGARWVRGYWNATSAGYQWVPGFWLSTQAGSVEYLPAPPATLEAGPVGAAPVSGAMWVQGCWLWRSSRYAWRPGFWAAGRSDWVWVPAHYAWTPRGFVFCAGYWDYALTARGMLFAPIACRPVYYTRPTFVYTPSIIVRLEILFTSLFARPRYCHYYFGDYYGRRYAGLGIHPWYEYHTSRRWYDPVGAHLRRIHLHANPRWEADLRLRYARRALGHEPRPARTLMAQRAELQRYPERARDVLTAPLAQVAARRSASFRLHRTHQAGGHVFGSTSRERPEHRSEVRMPPATASAPAATVRPAPRTTVTRTGGTVRRPTTVTRPTPSPAARSVQAHRPRIFAAPGRSTPSAALPRRVPAADRPARLAPAPAAREAKKPAPQRSSVPKVLRPTRPAPAPAAREVKKPAPQRSSVPKVLRPSRPAPAPAAREVKKPEPRVIKAPATRRLIAPSRAPAREVQRPVLKRPAVPTAHRSTAPTIRRPTISAPAATRREVKRPDPRRPTVPAIRRPATSAPAIRRPAVSPTRTRSVPQTRPSRVAGPRSVRGKAPRPSREKKDD